MDEHEALIEYSEMTAFDFNSKEFKEVRRDFVECRNAITNFLRFISCFLYRFRPAKDC